MNEKPCTRTDRAVRWVVFHVAELSGIAVLAVLAVTVAVWFALLAVAGVAWWAVHEARDTRRQREIRAAADRRRMTTGDTTPSTNATTESREARS